MTALSVAALALNASTLHLGRPIHAYRALRMWRRSWLSREVLLFTLFAGSMQGTLAAIVMYLRHGKIEEPEAVTREREEAEAAGEPLDPEDDPVALPPEEGLGGARIAFGPFLILAALEYLLFGRQIMERWTSFLRD